MATGGRNALAFAILMFLAALPVGSAREESQPSLDQVLERAGQYVTRFHAQLASIVAEETYTQEVRRVPTRGRVVPPIVRTLRSDLLLVRRPGEDRYVEFRDVFEVDGVAVRDRQERLTALFMDPTAANSQRLKRIIDESARYNVGALTRNINTPLLALSFVERTLQPRFKFRRSQTEAPALPSSSSHATGNDGVFRVTSEMWGIEFEEKRRPTLIKTTQGRDFPAKGRLWIDPATGTVLMSELLMKNSRIDARIVVSYQSEPLLGFLVPVEMREEYTAPYERVLGLASYGRFRQFQVRTSERIAKPPG